MEILSATLTGTDPLDVRTFTVREMISAAFQIRLSVVSPNPAIDFDQAIGAPASFVIRGAQSNGARVDMPTPRVWSGVCSEIQQLRVETTGLSTYAFEIVPRLWLMTRRTNHRVFQYKSEVEIALQLLTEWNVRHEVRLDLEQYLDRKYKVQYGESDFDFFNRMLEECGVSYVFEQQGEETVLIVTDAPHTKQPRTPSLEFHDQPTHAPQGVSFATSLQVSRVVSPGALAVRDHDYRLPPTYKLYGKASDGTDVEKSLEVHESGSGLFLFRGRGGDTAVADSKGASRTDERAGEVMVTKRLAAMRADASRVVFETNAVDVGAGSVVKVVDHPRPDVDGKTFLVTEATIQGSHDSDWQIDCVTASAASPYRPPLRTPAPTAFGTESATVVGPAGEEIYVDEFGRVKCHFHWDRESKMDDDSSCWIHVSQGWAGAAYGSVMLPRIGQEVLVEFLGGDPDRPVVTGRVYTNLQKVPYGLPANKTQSGIKTHSSPSTGGYNELMFEDKAGAELLRMQAERDKSVLVKRNRSANVGVDCSTSVGNNSSTTVGNNSSLTVGANRSVTVSQNDSKTVGAAQNETIGATKSISAGSSVSISSGSSNIVLNAYETLVGLGFNVSVEADETLTLTAGDGASTIILSKNAIIINGPKVYINPGEDAIPSILETGSPPPAEEEPERPSVLDGILSSLSDMLGSAISAARTAIESGALNPIGIGGPIGIGIGGPMGLPSMGPGGRGSGAGGGGAGTGPFGGGGDFGGGGAGGSW